MTQLNKLFEPGRIGTMETKNRLIMSAMATYSGDPEGYPTQRTLDYYTERAKGGVGLIIVEATCFSWESRAPKRLWLYDDKFIPRLRELTSAAHQYGAKIALQLIHFGMALAEMRHDFEHPEEIEVVAPSAIPFVREGVVPKELSKEDIKRLVEGFSEAARRAKDAGFDAVEYHGAHGILISSFLSPLKNRRADEYGGSVEKRARFACEILTRTRQKVGPSFPLSLRISGCDYLPGGITIEDTVRQAPLFVEAGADVLHVSASDWESHQWQYLSYLFPDGALVPLAAAVKKAVKVPVITVGKLGDPVLANRVLEEGKADFVALGRPFFADPELPNKAKDGRLDEIRRCIFCDCCEDRYSRNKLTDGRTYSCTVNPAVLREREFALKPAARPKKVMVIGGGLAGMEAARVMAERGHQVSLYEKSDRLGGQWDIACRQKHKEGFAHLTRYLIRSLDKAGVEILLNKEVTPELVKQVKPDVAVVAAGATPAVPEVPGANGKNVVQANDVITGKAKVGERVVVIGGRYLGMEIADFLAEQGKKVSLVTRSRLGREVGRNVFLALRDRLIEHGVYAYPNSPLREIKEKGVYVVNNQELLFLEADTVVLAVGVKPENRLAEELKGIVPEVYAIGDCVEPQNAMMATHQAAELARQV